MGEPDHRKTPVLLLPFVWLWRLFGLVIRAVGRVLCAVFGLALMIAGVALSMSIIALPAGIPISVLGFLLLVRALF